MAQWVEGRMTFTAGEALAAYRGVRLTSARTVSLCAAGERPDGFTDYAVASGDQVSIIMANRPGSVKLDAAGTVVGNALAYMAASGKVDDTVAGDPIGRFADSVTGAHIAEVILHVGYNDLSNVRSTFSFKDDFMEGFDTTATTGKWVKGGDTAAAAIVGDAAGGILDMTCGANDNDQVIFNSINETFKLAAGKNLTFQARIIPVEAQTNESMWFIGLSDTVTADHLTDNAGAIRSSFDGFGFYKSTGDLNLRVVTSNAATQTAEDSGVDVVSGTAMLLKITVTDDGTTATLKFYVDDVLAKTHTCLLSGLEEMHVLMVQKTGTANAENTKVDYIEVNQKR